MLLEPYLLLGLLSGTPTHAASPEPHVLFRLRLPESVDSVEAVEALRILRQAYAEFSKMLGTEPPDSVDVTFESAGDPGVPEWAEAVNDGTIRIPLRDGERGGLQLRRLLRHELAHSFVSSATGGNCPTWLQEGISQWLEGGDPSRSDARMAQSAVNGALPALVTLEGPFSDLDVAERRRVYDASLSAVAHLLRTRQKAGIRRLLECLGSGRPMEEALPLTFGWRYPDLQKSWSDYLAAR